MVAACGGQNPSARNGSPNLDPLQPLSIPTPPAVDVDGQRSIVAFPTCSEYSTKRTRAQNIESERKQSSMMEQTEKRFLPPQHPPAALTI
eukprot:scaffold35493_cov51-Attheya_sp.AAC.1